MMTNRSMVLPGVLLGILFSAGCGSGGSPTGTETRTGTVRLQNQSTTVTISDLRIFACGATNAGPNRLTALLNPGSEASVSVNAGCYDVNAFPADNLNQTTRHFVHLSVSSGETETLVVTDTP